MMNSLVHILFVIQFNIQYASILVIHKRLKNESLCRIYFEYFSNIIFCNRQQYVEHTKYEPDGNPQDFSDTRKPPNRAKHDRNRRQDLRSRIDTNQRTQVITLIKKYISLIQKVIRNDKNSN